MFVVVAKIGDCGQDIAEVGRRCLLFGHISFADAVLAFSSPVRFLTPIQRNDTQHSIVVEKLLMLLCCHPSSVPL